MFVALNKFLFMCLLLLDKARGAGSSFLLKSGTAAQHTPATDGNLFSSLCPLYRPQYSTCIGAIYKLTFNFCHSA